MRLSIVYYFIIITKTLQLHQTLIDSCLNFEITNYNVCEKVTSTFQAYGALYRPSCMQCIIRDIHIKIKSNCLKNFECATLIFEDNFIFEKFFIKHHQIIPSLFPIQFEILSTAGLTINITNYNITKITNEYINSVLNIKSSQIVIYLVLHRRFPNLTSLTFESERFFITFGLLVIFVRCDYGNRFIEFYINPKDNGDLRIINRCQNFQMSTLLTMTAITSGGVDIKNVSSEITSLRNTTLKTRLSFITTATISTRKMTTSRKKKSTKITWTTIRQPTDTSSLTTIIETIFSNTDITIDDTLYSSSTSTKPLQTLLYIAYKLPVLIICIPIILFLVFSCYSRRKRRNDEDLYSISDMFTNSDRSTSSSNKSNMLNDNDSF